MSYPILNKILFLLFLGGSCRVAGQDIQADETQCAHCTMRIRDPRFAAVATDKEGGRYTFDAIECLINFLKNQGEEAFEKILVADYSVEEHLVDARSATYLKSNAIPSPMGAYLSAFRSRGTAEKVQNEQGGTLYDWKQVKALFKDSRFGLLDHPEHHHRPDAYAPPGIMGDHVHHQGSFMIGLWYMHMEMDGSRRGSREVTNMEIHHRYMVAPQRMQMTMYMLSLMYAPTDKLTIMLMQDFIQKEMALSAMTGMNFTTQSTGLGDTKISALYSLLANEKASFHLNSGVSIPKGKIKMTDDTPMAQDMKLPYSMQIGSGTIDLNVGATFRQAFRTGSWGMQQISLLRTSKNTEGYHQGHQFTLNTWASRNLASWISISARAEAIKFSRIAGIDEELNPMMAPTAHTINSGFTKVRTYLGSNISFHSYPALKSLKIGVEYGLPLYQNVNGIQMDEGNTLIAGIRYLL